MTTFILLCILVTYWLFGYGMSFGRGPLTNPFIAIGDFLLGLIHNTPEEDFGIKYFCCFLDPPAGDPLMGPIFGMKFGRILLKN